MLKTGHDLSDQEIRKAYSRIIKKVSMPRYFYSYVSELVQAWRPRCLLDVGCGNGFLLQALAQRLPSTSLWGLEPSASLAASAQSRSGGSWAIATGSALQIPFGDASFDAVTMTEVFEHLREPVTALREVKRVLRKEGMLLLTIPNMSAYEPFWRFAERIPVAPVRNAFLPWEHPLKTFQPIDTAYSHKEITRTIEQSGLSIEKITAREFFPYVTTTIPYARRLFARYAQRRSDDLLGRVLPASRGYRLFIECSA